LPLTGSHADPKKNDMPNFEMVSFEPDMSSIRINRTMAKMLSAHNNMRKLKVRSASEELPQLRRYVRTGEGEGSPPGDAPLSVRWVTSAWPATRGTWVSDLTTHTVAGFSEFQVKPAQAQNL
jgi:hypothetical protein